MGLFSRKNKGTRTASITTTQLKPSLGSAFSSLKSPVATVYSGRMPNNRASIGTMHSAGNPCTPLTPLSPGQPPPTTKLALPSSRLQKMDMPRPPDPQLDPAGYLRSLGAVRDRCRILTEKAGKNQLKHFRVDNSKFCDVVKFVANIIKRDYDAPFTSIPPHGRHQHFAVGGRDRVAHLLSTFPQNLSTAEKCRRMIDLFMVSVLLDAGAGTAWSFKSSENGRVYRRSEGIAVASLEMFKTGLFSSDPTNKYRVDKDALKRLSIEQLGEGLQSGPGHEIAGLEGRTNLLLRLGAALDEKQEFFGLEGRPGNMLDHILAHPSTKASSQLIVPLPVLWNVLMNGLAPIWPPSRTAINGVSLGDAWPCSSMPQPPQSPSGSFSPFPQGQGPAPWESILPFHKLTQWLTYSIMQPMQSIMKMHFAGQELLTGLPEYRNGGLLIDLGVLTLCQEDMERGLANYLAFCARTGSKGVEVAPMFEPGDDVIVEWRGVTVGFLDRLVDEVNVELRPALGPDNNLTLAQVLEAGSWKGGREIAEMSRPITKEPPILIDSDGTVF